MLSMQSKLLPQDRLFFLVALVKSNVQEIALKSSNPTCMLQMSGKYKNNVKFTCFFNV